jgi:hypothetical protein
MWLRLMRSWWPPWGRVPHSAPRCCQKIGFALAELADLFVDPATARDRWRPLAESKLAELDTQIHQAMEAKRLLERAPGV